MLLASLFNEPLFKEMHKTQSDHKVPLRLKLFSYTYLQSNVDVSVKWAI